MAIVAIPLKYFVRSGSFTVQNLDNRSLSGGRQLVYLVSLYERRYGNTRVLASSKFHFRPYITGILNLPSQF